MLWLLVLCVIMFTVLISEFASYMWHRFASHDGLGKHATYMSKVVYSIVHPTHKRHHDVYHIDDKHKAYEDFIWVATNLSVIALVVIAIDLFVDMSWHVKVLVATGYVTAVVHSLFKCYIHGAYHTPGIWLEKYEFFDRWKRLHLIHHEDAGVNFSLSWYVPDMIFGTLRE